MCQNISCVTFPTLNSDLNIPEYNIITFFSIIIDERSGSCLGVKQLLAISTSPCTLVIQCKTFCFVHFQTELVQTSERVWQVGQFVWRSADVLHDVPRAGEHPQRCRGDHIIHCWVRPMLRVVVKQISGASFQHCRKLVIGCQPTIYFTIKKLYNSDK